MTNKNEHGTNVTRNDHNGSTGAPQIGGIRRGPLPAKNYTVLPNQIFDAPLTFKALGILNYFLQKPPDWTISSPAALSKLAYREGREAIRAGFKELIDTGYMVQRGFKDDQGRFVTEWVVYDYPVDNPNEETPGQPKDGKPATENRRRETGDGNPSSYISTNELNTYLSDFENLAVDNRGPCQNCDAGWILDDDGKALKRCECDYSLPSVRTALSPTETEFQNRYGKNTGESAQSNSKSAMQKSNITKLRG